MSEMLLLPGQSFTLLGQREMQQLLSFPFHFGKSPFWLSPSFSVSSHMDSKSFFPPIPHPHPSVFPTPLLLTSIPPQQHHESHGQQNHLPLPVSRLFHGNGRRHHRARLFAIQTPRLNFHVHHRCHRRCRALQWNLQGGQLATSRLACHFVDCDDSDCWVDWWGFDGGFVEYSSFWKLREG